MSILLRPPSAIVFSSNSFFKTSGLLFQRNGNANFLNFSTLLGTEVRIPMYYGGSQPVCRTGLSGRYFPPIDTLPAEIGQL